MRRDDAEVCLPPVVIAREGGRSSTPRFLGSHADVSGILDRPIKSGDDEWGKSGDDEWGMMVLRAFQTGCLKS
jgi:hypothetical protein